jgi:hypothetical protein
MRFVLLLCSTLAFAQTYDVTPPVVRQGEVLRVRTSVDGLSARLNGRTIRLFHQSDGGSFGLMPIPVEEHAGKFSLEFVDLQGAVQHTTPITILDAHYPIQNIAMSSNLTQLKLSPGEADTSAAFRRLVTDTRFWQEPFVLPVNGCLTSPFGVRRFHNGKPTGDYHAGLDQGSPAGTPIHAIADGTVKIVKSWNLHGNTVGIDHGQGVLSMYLHMSKFNTTEGATVKKGDVIGYVGATGRATGPHLHWSIYVNDVPVSPGLWVKAPACAPAKPAAKKK